MSRIVLSGSVGPGGDNHEADIGIVRDRLRQLGFSWIGGTGGGTARHFVRAIKLFQAITTGETKFVDRNHSGRISVGRGTHRWLAAVNAPRWIQIMGHREIGWSTTEMTAPLTEAAAGGTPYLLHNGGWGTSWIVDMLNAAGRDYIRRVRDTYFPPDLRPPVPWNDRNPNPGPFTPLAWDRISMHRDPMPPMWVRDCAPAQGGRADYHGSHETGLDVDMRLPLLDSSNGATATNVPWRYLAGRSARQQHFNRTAARAQLESLVAQSVVQVIGFDDDTAATAPDKLHRIRKVRPWANHKDHFHVRIQPPARTDGEIA
ncbi:penicillin-insensitive murein endopeptidase [Paraglaciecola arctica]|nr:penicillin-insensitive murein endopeptidase [Paraglaciecola arctica]